MREDLPLLAINHEYLVQVLHNCCYRSAYHLGSARHGLLAWSVLHMAFLHPNESDHCEFQATYHQNVMLPLSRSALASVTESNCHAVYACGHLRRYHLVRSFLCYSFIGAMMLVYIAELWMIPWSCWLCHLPKTKQFPQKFLYFQSKPRYIVVNSSSLVKLHPRLHWSWATFASYWRR